MTACPYPPGVVMAPVFRSSERSALASEAVAAAEVQLRLRLVVRDLQVQLAHFEVSTCACTGPCARQSRFCDGGADIHALHRQGRAFDRD